MNLPFGKIPGDRNCTFKFIIDGLKRLALSGPPFVVGGGYPNPLYLGSICASLRAIAITGFRQVGYL